MKKFLVVICLVSLGIPAQADECSYLARKFAYEPNDMEIVEVARLSKCVSEYLSLRVSGKSGRYGGSYPPQPTSPPPERRKPMIMEDKDNK